MTGPATPRIKPLIWVASSRNDLRKFPEGVKDVFGFALYEAQCGGKHVSAKPLKGFGGAGVLEVVEDHDGSTYRAVYTVKLRGVVYVLSAFQKKSKTGVKTPRTELDRIRQRLKEALRDFKERYEHHDDQTKPHQA